jgi:hypothetical protein
MGDTSFQEMISSAYIDDDWKPEIFSDIFAPWVFNPLPLKDEAMSLLCDPVGSCENRSLPAGMSHTPSSR